MSVEKTFQKTVVLTTAQFLAKAEAGTLLEGVSYQLSDALAGIEGVKVNNTLLTPDANGVVNVPIATGTDAGVVRAADTYAAFVSSNGYLQTSIKTYAQYGSIGNAAFVGKGTLENVLDNESVRFDKATSLTENNKTQARTNIGAAQTVSVTIDLE